MPESRGDTILGKIINKKEPFRKLARQNSPEETCSTSTKTSPIKKLEPLGNILITSASVSIQAVE